MLTNLTPLIISVLLRAVVESRLVDSAYARTGARGGQGAQRLLWQWLPQPPARHDRCSLIPMC